MPYLVREHIFFGDINDDAIAALTVSGPNADTNIRWLGLYMSVVIFNVKLLRHCPERCYRCDPLSDDDLKLGSSAFLIILMQIPDDDHHP
ncbi:hypothetical protein GUJ93_ZPchr0012g20668 [Zizania palustris]|uniref:Uncharacterized protein n=1 Tax=Zizania palustris TaxID=103762 RepID=A0A8J5WRR9_ZIZPA|nr:hypothetical protein GUJ93_ZPchr0012g20668 [Zizania palustris]